jgi:hypothetical protein
MSTPRGRVQLVRDRATEVGRTAGQRAAGIAKTTWTQTRSGADRARQVTSDTVRIISENARPEIEQSVERLTKVRSPGEVMSVFEEEVRRILNVVVPVFVENPVPIRDPRVARAVVGLIAAGAAGAEEIEELSLIFSSGVSAPGIVTVLAFVLLALLVEVGIAASLRANTIRNAGLEPDPATVARDVQQAMLGAGPLGKRFAVKAALKNPASRKVLSRWAGGLIPVAGVVYSAWDAQATIAAIAAMPIHDAATEPPALGPAPSLAH